MVALALSLLVLSNAVWLWAWLRREKQTDQERGRLLNRILHPEIPQEVDRMVSPPDEELITAPMSEEDKAWELAGSVDGRRADE